MRALDGDAVVISQPNISDFSVALKVVEGRLHFGREINVRPASDVASTLERALPPGNAQFSAVKLKP